MNKVFLFVLLLCLSLVTGQTAFGTSYSFSGNGTYSYNGTSSGGSLSWNWQESTFYCNGPEIGESVETITSLTTTTMQWGEGDDTMSWSRTAGVPGDITGTWTATDSEGTYTLTFNANGTMTVTASVSSCSYNPPTISSFSPTSGQAGSRILINGTDFSPLPAENLVSFNGLSAVVTGVHPNQLSVLVPSGATSGKISVANSVGTAVSTTNFTVQAGTSTASLAGGGVHRRIDSEGQAFDAVYAVLNVYSATLNGNTVTVTGPSGFSYTFTTADITPGVDGQLILYRKYASLSAGLYTFTLNGNSTTAKTDTHVAAALIPQVSSESIQLVRKSDGGYRISWTPLNTTDSYYYRVRVARNDSESAPIFQSPFSADTFIDLPAGRLFDRSAYKIRIETGDNANGDVATIRSDSAWKNFSPREEDYNPTVANLAGFISNPTGKTGRIYISVYAQGQETGYGTSILSPGSSPAYFSIRGIPMSSNTYMVQAFLDTSGTGIRHANDPDGTSSSFTVASGITSIGTLTLQTPAVVSAQAPEVMAYKGNGGNFVIWNGPETDQGVIADKYTIFWNTTPSLAGASSKDVPSGFNDFFAHAGGSSALYYLVRAVAGATQADSVWVQTSAGTATGSVTGKVNFTGVPSVTGPLYIALLDDSNDPPVFNVAAVSTPSSGGSYTIGNVPAGTYNAFAFLDLNNSGTYDAGDVGWLDNDDFGTKVTVGSSQATVPDITLKGANASTVVATTHGRNQGGDWYNIDFTVESMLKRVVNVQVSGPQIPSAFDMLEAGKEIEGYVHVSNRPAVGDTYQLKIIYADGSSDTVNKNITAVVDAFPSSLAPVGTIPYSDGKPTFSWATPSPAPAEFVYNMWVSEQNGGNMWDAWEIPGSQTSILYGSRGDVVQSSLNADTPYTWALSLIDRDGNRSFSENSFTMVEASHVSANGTYSFSGGTLSWNWQTSTFSCNGPDLGSSQQQVTTLTATTLSWLESDGHSTTWTRVGTGADGDITGTWAMTDPENGNSYTLVFSGNGTMSVTADIYQCDSGGGDPSGNGTATITGTIANSTGKSGRIYVGVYSESGERTGYGTSITGPGAFTIRGVPASNSNRYTIRAFVDTVGNGVQHAGDPRGSSSQITPNPGIFAAGTVVVAVPALQPPQTPGVYAVRGSGGNMLFFDAGTDSNDFSLADTFTIAWSSDNGATVAGSTTVKGGEDNFFLHHGGSSSYKYRVTASGGGQSVSSPWTGLTGFSGQTVSGRINFSGTASGPLSVVLWNDQQGVYLPGSFSGTSFPRDFTITNVPAGTYGVFAFLDMNSSGTFDEGDLEATVEPFVTVGTSPATVPELTIVVSNARAEVGTNHFIDSKYSYENYNLSFELGLGKKRPVAATITSGPNLPLPLDIGVDDEGEFELWVQTPRPNVGDSYDILVTYADGTAEVLTTSVTAVLDEAPVPVAPMGPVAYNGMPTFNWQAPAGVSPYTYNIWLSEQASGNFVWEAWDVPGTITSVTYDGDPLTDGTEYGYSLGMSDSSGNQVQTLVRFTPTSSPAISGFTPRGGLAGTTVTISGLNFSPTPSANSVTFNGTAATVTAATATNLTVTVPSGASTGKIAVTTGGKTATTEQDFLVAAPITLTGAVVNAAGTPVSGVLVEQPWNPGTPTSISGTNGQFAVTGIFANTSFQLRLSKSGYQQVYTSLWLDRDTDATATPFVMLTAAELAAGGGIAGKGTVMGVVDNGSGSPLAGVQVSAQSQNSGTYYEVKYHDGTSFTGIATHANGRFTVINVEPNDVVILRASKSPWTFYDFYEHVNADSVTEMRLSGWMPPPYINNISTYSGKAGSSVTISGSNFSTTPSGNSVYFNGVAAVVTSASSSSLTVTVPAGATTGQISVTTLGGTATWGSFTIMNTLTASITGTGQGTVTSTYPYSGISCQSGSSANCSSDFNQGQYVELVAAQGAGAIFNGWTGCDSISNTICSVTLNADRTVTAAFTAALDFKIEGASPLYFGSLADAYGSATTGSTIKAQAKQYVGPFTFGRGIAILLSGGFDANFTSATGYTTLRGPVAVTGGTVTVEKIAVQ